MFQEYVGIFFIIIGLLSFFTNKSDAIRYLTKQKKLQSLVGLNPKYNDKSVKQMRFVGIIVGISFIAIGVLLLFGILKLRM